MCQITRCGSDSIESCNFGDADAAGVERVPASPHRRPPLFLTVASLTVFTRLSMGRFSLRLHFVPSFRLGGFGAAHLRITMIVPRHGRRRPGQRGGGCVDRHTHTHTSQVWASIMSS